MTTEIETDISQNIHFQLYCAYRHITIQKISCAKNERDCRNQLKFSRRLFKKQNFLCFAVNDQFMHRQFQLFKGL